MADNGKKVIKRVVVKGVTVKKVKGPRKRKALKRGNPAVRVAAQPHNAAMVTLEDRQMMSLLADPRFNGFPCLQTAQSELKTVRRTCSRCSRKRQQARAKTLREARACVSRMTSQQQAEFKKLLGTQKVQVMVATPVGVKAVTF